ncbi:MAG: hypothetical protein CL583_04760 [Alteromonadaceae bacterium]|nr:hypothetical protein [Alteromonadaceae bacterium]
MAASVNTTNPSKVLAKATRRAALRLSIPEEQLTAILGVDVLQADAIEPTGTNGQRALQIIRVYKRLSAITGNDSGAMAHWMTTRNKWFNCSPRERIASGDGLDDVVSYLDSVP